MTAESIAARSAHDSAIAVVLVSPCEIEVKDQDRAVLIPHEKGWIGVLCDGTTQSMHSVDAAELVTSDPAALWTENGVAKVVTRLNEARCRVIAEATDEEPEPDSFISRAMAKFMREAREHSFQTTFVTARVMAADTGFVVDAKSVGDTALLIFDSDGERLISNLNIPDRDSGFGHTSSITEVLPDHFSYDDITLHEEVSAGTHIVLCSDGFYEAFSTPRELLRWLIDHEDELRDDSRKLAAVKELHARLDRRTGDDDLSLIWLCPRAMPDAETLPAEKTETSPLPAPVSSLLSRTLAALARPFRAKRARLSRFDGENAS